MNLDDLLNIREAAELTGRSEMTIRKYLGLTKPPRPTRLPNARKQVRPGEAVATWAIPLSDLHNSGLMKPGKSNQLEPGAATPGAVEPQSDILAALRAENLELRAALELAQAKLELTTANLADLRLLAGRSIETLETQAARKRFWQR